MAPVEYVVVRKLQYYVASHSDRHLRDVAMMLRISGDLIDELAMTRWVGELGLAGAYREARRLAPR